MNNVALVLDAKGIEWLCGDAMVEHDVVGAARGAQLIVHAVNPPGYRNWGKLVLPMIANTIAAARASGARILLPGTVYNYGPDAFPLIAEDAPQRPLTRKGAIRVELEARLQAAARDDGVRVLIVRAGDFFGPRAGNTWFSQGLVKPGAPLTAVTDPGRAGVGTEAARLFVVAAAACRAVCSGTARNARNALFVAQSAAAVEPAPAAVAGRGTAHAARRGGARDAVGAGLPAGARVSALRRLGQMAQARRLSGSALHINMVACGLLL